MPKIVVDQNYFPGIPVDVFTNTNLTIGGQGSRTLLLPACTYHLRLASL